MLAPVAAARGHAVRRDARRIKEDDAIGADARRRLLVLHALRDRQAAADLRAPQGHDEGGRGGRARRQRARARATRSTQIGTYAVSRDGNARRVGRGHRRPQPVRAAHQGPRDRRACSPTPRPTSRAELAWANDNKTLFYVGKDATTLREDRVLRHVARRAGTTLGLREDDGQYYVGVDHDEVATLHRDRARGDDDTARSRLIDADKPAARAARRSSPRERGSHLQARSPRRPLRDAHERGREELPPRRGPPRQASATAAQWQDVDPARRRHAGRGLRGRTTRSSRRIGAHRRAAQGRSVLPTSGKPFFIDAQRRRRTR